MAGWFEAISNFARGAAPALDRYQQLRQMDEDNIWKRRIQQAQLDQESQQRQLGSMQIRQIEDALTRQRQNDLISRFMPGQELNDQATSMLDDAGVGYLVNKGTHINPLEKIGPAQVNFGPNLAGIAPTPDGQSPVEFVQTPDQKPLTLPGQNFAMPDRPVTTNEFLGTPAQQLDYTRTMTPILQKQADERMNMAALALLPPEQRALAMLSLRNPGFDTSAFVQKPPTGGGEAAYLAQLGGANSPEGQAWLQSAGAIARARHINDGTGGGAGDGGNIPVFKEDSPEGRLAKDLAYGRMTFAQFNRMLSARGANSQTMRAGIYDLATQMNPNFTPAGFEAGYKFATSPTTMNALAAIDAVLPNITKLTEMLQSSGNGDATGINRLINSGKLFFGNRKITNIAELAKITGDELGVALGKGTVTDMSRQLGLDLANMNLSPANATEVLGTIKTALENRRQSYLPKMGPYNDVTLNPTISGAGHGDAPQQSTGKGQMGVDPRDGQTYEWFQDEKGNWYHH